jgi:tRNA(Leu) C34 or U34 (ribose-2'-O)-methylase TrmL
MGNDSSSVGLINPKFNPNVGSISRLCTCYDVGSLIVQGERYQRKARADTTKYWRTHPVVNVPNLIDSKPVGMIPVAVEITDDAKPLESYRHFRHCFYVFGPEDGSVPTEILKRCEEVIKIPTSHCLNLAFAVQAVLYDRKMKEKFMGFKNPQ